MPARNLLIASLVAPAALALHVQAASGQQGTPMPETTTQAPAPVVRWSSHPGASQQIIPNPDGSLPRSVHTGEYQQSYPAGHPPRPKTTTGSSIPTINPLTSLSPQSAYSAPKPPAPIKPPVLPKLPAPIAAPRPKPVTLNPAQTAMTPAAAATNKPAVTKPVVVAKPAIAAKPTEPAEAATLLPAGPFNRTVIVIDPSHGGNDVGSRIADSVLEKDVDLQFAFKLRSLLSARGFTVVLTRESDTDTMPDKPDSPLSLDVRAGLANRQQAAACLLIHATGSGHGAHLYASELNSVPAEPYAAPWLTAQNGWVSQSLRLEKQIGSALTRAGLPLVLSRASVRPVDSLTCPALVIELAPENDKPASINGDGYQQRVANAVATALIFWQNSAQPPARLAPPVYKPPVVAPKPEISSITPTTTATPAVQP